MSEPEVIADLPDDQYHASRNSLSCSGAKLLLPPSCPAKFRAHMDNPPQPKREYDFGHLAHKLVLGKGADIVEIDAPDFRTKDAREARDKAHANGQIPALATEVDKAREMARKVLEHPVAGPWFTAERGVAEQSVYADDETTGIRLRCRPDWLLLDDALCIDYKTSTTANPAELTRKFHQFGYHIQAAWYPTVLRLAGVADSARFVFVVQEKVPPYLVTVVEYDTDAVIEGARLAGQAIDLYARCVERCEWPGYSDGIVPLSLPRWVTRGDVLAEADSLIAELEGIA